jgi:hypothetical protein
MLNKRQQFGISSIIVEIAYPAPPSALTSALRRPQIAMMITVTVIENDESPDIGRIAIGTKSIFQSSKKDLSE